MFNKESWRKNCIPSKLAFTSERKNAKGSSCLVIAILRKKWFHKCEKPTNVPYGLMMLKGTTLESYYWTMVE